MGKPTPLKRGGTGVSGGDWESAEHSDSRGRLEAGRKQSAVSIQPLDVLGGGGSTTHHGGGARKFFIVAPLRLRSRLHLTKPKAGFLGAPGLPALAHGRGDIVVYACIFERDAETQRKADLAGWDKITREGGGSWENALHQHGRGGSLGTLRLLLGPRKAGSLRVRSG